MPEYIERNALFQRIHTGMNIVEAMTEIINAPVCDVRPLVRGKWLEGKHRQPCNVCHYKGMRSWNYCPNCGAVMEKNNVE